jgi:hypothetical protein
MSALSASAIENTAAGQALVVASEASTDILPQFVDFTSGLVRNVIATVVGATVDQLEAYADLVAKVSGSLANYEQRTIGDPNLAAVKYINENLLPQFGLASPPVVSGHYDTAGTTWTTTQSGSGSTLSFDPAKLDGLKAVFSGISATVKNSSGVSTATLFDDPSVLVPNPATNPTSYDVNTEMLHSFAVAKLKQDVEKSFDKLVALLQLGMDKVSFEECTIRTSITLHTDSQQTATSSSSQSQFDYRASASSRTGSLALSIIGRSFGFGLSGSASSSQVATNYQVNVVNETKTSIVNSQIDITGFVELKFISRDAFPKIDPQKVAAS